LITYITQIFNPVIGSDAIDVIDHISRPFTMIKRPNHAMSFKLSTINAAMPVSGSIECGERFLVWRSWSWPPCFLTISPEQFASLRLIAETLVQIFNGR
jgi:hypothetical protein